MADRLQVSELDFDAIKTSLKNFLKQQSEFTDYDFEGSGMSVLLDILAYNTHYNSYYLNMIANESFLDTALLRNSVVSHAKKMGYTPRSARASRAIVDVKVETNSAVAGSLTIPRGYNLLSNVMDGRSYNFIVMDDVTVAKVGTDFLFENLPIFEGYLVSYNYVHDESSNPSQYFTIPDADVDTSTLSVSVRPSTSNTETEVYNLSTDVVTVQQNDAVYYLDEIREGKYQIFFGDGIIGKKLPDGAVVTLSYLVTSGDLANGASRFNVSSSISGFGEISSITKVNASGGSTRETVDQIKYAAPLSLTSQNRAVTKNDYVRLIQQKYPQFEAVNVWGGEENEPPIFGKVFISAKPKNGFEVTQTEKDFVINNILKPISVMTVTPQIVDVDYNYLKIISKVFFDPSKTSTNSDTLKTAIKNTIQNYCNTNLNQFNTYFKSSGLRTVVDSASSSIISNELEVFVIKKFRPDLINSNNYVLDFGVELERGTTYDNFFSSPTFTMLDENGAERDCSLEEVPSSYTGIQSITVTNPGINYSSTPTIEIVGDGTGARAVANIVNSRLNSIDIISPGVGYTSAAIRIIGGGGQFATATAVLEGRYGQIRTVYFRPDEITNQSTKVVLNANDNNGVSGTIDYLTGKIYLNNFNPIRIFDIFGNLRVGVRPKVSTIKSDKNKMLVIDDEDPTSIVVEMEPVYPANIASLRE